MIGQSGTHAWMAHMALRISASSGLPLQPAKASSCVLDLLGHLHPQSHVPDWPII